MIVFIEMCSTLYALFFTLSINLDWSTDLLDASILSVFLIESSQGRKEYALPSLAIIEYRNIDYIFWIKENNRYSSGIVEVLSI